MVVSRVKGACLSVMCLRRKFRCRSVCPYVGFGALAGAHLVALVVHVVSWQINGLLVLRIW